MSGLGFNKIAGAVLATAFAVVGLNELTAAVFTPEIAPKGDKSNWPAVSEGGGEAAPVVDNPPDWGTVLPAANIQAGADVFAKCASCHKPTDENNTGPGLLGVVGRPVATHAGFAYSEPMKAEAKKHATWGYDDLYVFLRAPQKEVPGSKMTFVGLKKPEDRINVIAYLHSLSPTLPIPAPDPARAAAAAAPAAGAPGVAPTPGAPAAPGAPGAATAPVPSPAGTNTVPPAGAPGAPAAAPVAGQATH